MLYDILLKVQADDPHRIPLQFLQIIIHGKGEVGFAASELNNGGLPALVQVGKDILNELQETV